MPARSSRRPSPRGALLPERRLRPVGLAAALDAVVRSAARFCEAHDSRVFRVDEGRLRRVAHSGALRPPVALGETIPLAPRLFDGRVLLERRPIHIRDVEADARQHPDSMPLQRVGARARSSSCRCCGAA